MTDRSFFDSPLDDSAERLPEVDDGFACSRRLVDLTHTVEATPEKVAAPEADWPTHPEIVELIESLLAANPKLQPARETDRCERPHLVYVPENYEHAYAYPLVVWFHGDGGSETDLRRVMPQISDRNYIGVALRGNVSSGSGYGWSPKTLKTDELLHDVRAITTSLRREYHIHSERIYLAGFGSGAAAAIELMLQKPEWFGGALSLNGEFPQIDRQPLVHFRELKNKRILLATSLGCRSAKIGDVVAAGRLLYSAGMQVGTRVYQDVTNAPSKKMLRDVDSWLMDDVCSPIQI